MHFFLPLILTQVSIMKSDCSNNEKKKIIAVLIILPHLMTRKALNEPEDKYFSGKTDVLTGHILCTHVT